MVENTIQQKLSRFAPTLILISITLIVTGTLVLLYFGYTVFHLIQYPEQSELLKYILSQLPAPPEISYTFKIVIDGHTSEVIVPAAFLGYGRFIFAFIIWSMLSGLIVGLVTTGVNILRALMDKPTIKEKITSD